MFKKQIKSKRTSKFWKSENSRTSKQSVVASKKIWWWYWSLDLEQRKSESLDCKRGERENWVAIGSSKKRLGDDWDSKQLPDGLLESCRKGWAFKIERSIDFSNVEIRVRGLNCI